jgi:tetraacyldisaccharide 4'-kinase
VATDPQRPADTPLPARRREQAWLNIVSGRERGFSAGLARAGLTILSLLYRAGLAFVNLRLRLPGAVRRIARPVISVGNLTVGGTGKTPMTALVARLVMEMGARPVIVSRGYAARPGERNEEALELERLAAGVAVIHGRDRWQAIHDHMWRQPCDLAILDDGFQHRRLARDLDILLVDALRPFGYGHLLPRGLLREPPSALRRADLVVITRADLVEPAALADLKGRLQKYLTPGATILVAAHRPTALLEPGGRRCPPETLRGETVAAACGIGNPEAFRATLERLGARVALWEVFPDHWAYTAEDVARLIEAARSAGVKWLVTTRKDYVKWETVLTNQGDRSVRVACLEVEMALVEGDEMLRRAVQSLLPPSAEPNQRLREVP